MATKKKTAKKKKKTATKTKTVSKLKVASSSKRSATTARRAAPVRRRRPPVDPDNFKPLTEQELEYFRELLLVKRRELIGDVGHMRDGALDAGRNDVHSELSTMPIHMADVGTDNYEQEFTLGLIESERKTLMDIDLALSKIDQGTYGL